jgi:hypothetical protein
VRLPGAPVTAMRVMLPVVRVDKMQPVRIVGKPVVAAVAMVFRTRTKVPIEVPIIAAMVVGASPASVGQGSRSSQVGATRDSRFSRVTTRAVVASCLGRLQGGCQTKTYKRSGGN